MSRRSFPDALREHIAAAQHEIWINWMTYLFSVGTLRQDGSYTIPAEKVSRWQRQMNTYYQDLTEKEKESDRDQAEKILDILTKI